MGAFLLKYVIQHYLNQPCYDRKKNTYGIIKQVSAEQGSSENESGIFVDPLVSIKPPEGILYTSNSEDVKLILKRPSMMFENEFYQLLQSSGEYELHPYKRSHLYDVHRKNMALHGVAGLFQNPQTVIERIEWLHSNGFDLYGLIESGQALDRFSFKTEVWKS